MKNLQVEYNSLLSSSSILGVAFGSFVGGPLIQKFGRKEVIIASLSSLIVLSLLCIIPNFTLIIILRTIFGVVVGFLMVAVPKIVVETVPPFLLDYGFGSSTNMFIYLAVVLLLAIGLLNSNPHEEQTHELYKFVYTFPIPFCVIAIIGFHTLYKTKTP